MHAPKTVLKPLWVFSGEVRVHARVRLCPSSGTWLASGHLGVGVLFFAFSVGRMLVFASTAHGTGMWFFLFCFVFLFRSWGHGGGFRFVLPAEAFGENDWQA